MPNQSAKTLSFIDLFAGCGGLSLGLSQAGWRGLFAIERDPMAFETFSRNFLRGQKPFQFDWPNWLERRAWEIDSFLGRHEPELRSIRGTVDLIAGGPPCQGFSLTGRRKQADPRNRLFTRYVHLVRDVRPKAVVLENVPGMRSAHRAKGRSGNHLSGQKTRSYFDKLMSALRDLGYVAEGALLDASLFGVPQRRPRLIVVGLRSEIASSLSGGVNSAFKHIEICRQNQLRELRLSEQCSASDAISDLELRGRRQRPCVDPDSRAGFSELDYEGPCSAYQRLMHEGANSDAMNSMRLARHSVRVANRFRDIIASCRQGVPMSASERGRFGLLKYRVHPMAANTPAPTITTLPDDIVHYSDPRILTVRESARLQSFPDSFAFHGRYTTGGTRRTKECPRYTQVGNAVPPLLARAIGAGIAAAIAEHARLRASKSVVDIGRRAVTPGSR